jgi:hypothetical protein
MTEERMPLAELLQKAGDGDFLRSVAEAVLQMLMEADVEGQIGTGQLGVLVLKSLQPLRLGNLQAPELCLPRIERRVADPVQAAQIRRLRTSLLLLQHADNLLFRELRSLHRPVLLLGQTLPAPRRVFGMHRRRAYPFF